MAVKGKNWCDGYTLVSDCHNRQLEQRRVAEKMFEYVVKADRHAAASAGSG